MVILWVPPGAANKYDPSQSSSDVVSIILNIHTHRLVTLHYAASYDKFGLSHRSTVSLDMPCKSTYGSNSGGMEICCSGGHPFYLAGRVIRNLILSKIADSKILYGRSHVSGDLKTERQIGLYHLGLFVTEDKRTDS